MTNIELVTQPVKQVMMKLDMHSIDDEETLLEIQGLITSMPMTIDSSSTIRRTANITLHSVTLLNVPENMETLWVDRIIRAHYGIYDADIEDYVWFLLGSFILSDNQYTFDLEGREISLTLIDLMGGVTPERGNPIGAEITIPVDSNIRTVLEDGIEQFAPYKKHNVCNFDVPVPYDIEKPRATYPNELFEELVGLYSYYQQYYSRDGIYTVGFTPLSYYDPVVLNVDDMQAIVISEAGQNTYADIKNCTEIWGQELDAVYTADHCVQTDGVYHVNITETFEVLEDGMTVSVTPDANSVLGQQMQIQSTTQHSLYTQRGDSSFVPLKAQAMLKDVSYVIGYTEEHFVLRGESQIHAMAMEFNREPSDTTKQTLRTQYNCPNIAFVINPLSKFACDHSGMMLLKSVLDGGEYENICTTDLALERARYETWKTSRAKGSKTLRCLYVPWLDVNQKVIYRSVVDNAAHQYVVNKITVGDFDGTMTIEMTQFYPLYSWMTGAVWGSMIGGTWGDDLGSIWGEVTDSFSWGADMQDNWGGCLNSRWEDALPIPS